MPYPNMDALFYLASLGDQNSFSCLREIFKKRGANIYIGILKKIGKNQGISIDFDEIMDDLFLKSINEFDRKKGVFSFYSKYLLEHKIMNFIFNAQNKIVSNTFSLDENAEDGITYLDIIQNRDVVPIGRDIAINNFKYEISSPNRHESPDSKIKKRILVLKYGGYNDREITEILGITMSKFRRLVRESESLEYLSNLKLEMK